MCVNTATHGNTRQHTATHGNTLQHTKTSLVPPLSCKVTHSWVCAHCCTLQHPAAHCSTLQHTATHCNILQYTVAHCSARKRALFPPSHTWPLIHMCVDTAAHCNTPQHTAAQCSSLKRTKMSPGYPTSCEVTPSYVLYDSSICVTHILYTQAQQFVDPSRVSVMHVCDMTEGR